MANLNEIIRTNQEVFDKIAAGTHPTEAYNDDNVYEVELDDPVILGAEGSHTAVNGNNELVLDGVAIHATDPAVKEAEMVDGELMEVRTSMPATPTDNELLTAKAIHDALPDVPSLTHETWTFTLEDDTTVTKEVTLWSSQA